MPKRGRDTLTGGTHDVNPQWMNIPVTYTATNGGNVTSYVLPKSPLTQNGRAQIIEILKMIFCLGPIATQSAGWSKSMSVCTNNPGTSAEVALTDPKCLGQAELTCVLNTNGQYIYSHRVMVDCTDGAGHGILVATDNLYVQDWCNVAATQGSATIGPLTSGVKILYRYKNVSVQEYIGIVQSQN